MKRNSYVHCSFDLVESFKPRVPKTRVIGKFVSEEAETPRICTADTIQHMKITNKEHVYPLIPFLTTGYIIILIILTVQGQSISWLL